MINKSPAFQFYPNDWLGSTKRAMMTPEERGVYIDLLCHAWNDPDCSIPNDDKALSMLSGLGDRWFEINNKLIKECFEKKIKKNSRISNKRLLKERKKQNEWRKKCSEGGKKSHKPTENKDKLKDKENKGTYKGSSTNPPSKPLSKRQVKSNSSSLVFSLLISSSFKYSKDLCVDKISYADCFIYFWNTYPKRNGKRLGKEATLEKFMKVKEIDMLPLLNSVKNYSNSKGAKDNYAKDPKRFFIDNFWKDWIEPEKKAEVENEFTDKYKNIAK